MSSDTPEQTVFHTPEPEPPAAEPEDRLPGMKLGDYVVEEAIGWGGMGIVYRAVHPLIGRKVAVKVLRPNFAADPEQASRFLKEAQAISAIKHRGIIDIISFGNLPDGRQYMVMEYLDGETLEALMEREGALTPARALALIEEVLDALSAAHRVGVVHRDLKPANIYMAADSNGSRSVKLVDFGLARRAKLDDLNRGSGKASLMAGTPEYISPEQARGLTATPRTDLYCLGVMFFEMVTGELPFKAESVIELLSAHLSKAPPRASTLVSNLPSGVDELIDQLLKKQPEERPQSAERVKQGVVRLSRELRESATQLHDVESTPRVNPLAVGPVPVEAAGEAAPTSPATDRYPVVKSDTEKELKLVEARAADTQPKLDRLSRVPRWVWPVAGAGLLLAGVAGWQARQPADPATVVELGADPAPVKVEVERVIEAPLPSPPARLVEVPVEPEEKLPALVKPKPVVRVEPPRPRPVAVVAPPPPKVEELPAVCRSANWQEGLHAELNNVERPALIQRIDTAPLEAFHERVKAGARASDCVAIHAGFVAWKKRSGLQAR